MAHPHLYTNVAKLQNRFGARYLIQLTDPTSNDSAFTANELNGTTVTPRIAIINDAIQSAEATINGYLRAGGYHVPIPDGIPIEIQNATADIATYVLASIHGSNEFVFERYDNAIKFLKAVQKREIMLDIPNGQQPQTYAFAVASRNGSTTLENNANVVYSQVL